MIVLLAIYKSTLSTEELLPKAKLTNVLFRTIETLRAAKSMSLTIEAYYNILIKRQQELQLGFRNGEFKNSEGTTKRRKQ